ncbi:gypsy/ty3 retroelement polyprotein [Tanacetum coccineum]
MVATRSNFIENTPQTTNTTNTSPTLDTIQSSLDQIQESIRGLLLFQQFTTIEVNAIKNREGTSFRGNNGGNQYGRLTKLEFPKFHGEDVQGWLYRVQQFFTIDHVEDDAHKIRLVSMHMFDKALNWHKQFVRRFGENVTWQEYVREIKLRFDLVFEDPMVELKNLRQATSVHVYQDLFEALINKVELTESYAISLFIGGLKDEIGMAVRMFKPTKLTDVYCLAKMQEQTIAVSKGRHAPALSTPKNSFINPNTSKNVNIWGKTTPAQNTNIILNRPFKRLTQQELDEKTAKHLCFFCDQKYMLGHKYSGQVFSLETIRT